MTLSVEPTSWWALPSAGCVPGSRAIDTPVQWPHVSTATSSRHDKHPAMGWYFQVGWAGCEHTHCYNCPEDIISSHPWGCGPSYSQLLSVKAGKAQVALNLSRKQLCSMWWWESELIKRQTGLAAGRPSCWSTCLCSPDWEGTAKEHHRRGWSFWLSVPWLKPDVMHWRGGEGRAHSGQEALLLWEGGIHSKKWLFDKRALLRDIL